MNNRIAAALIAAVTLAACSEEQDVVAPARQASMMVNVPVTVVVNGPGGEHPCVTVPDAQYRIQMFSPGAPAQVVSAQFYQCPSVVTAATAPVVKTFSLPAGGLYDTSITINAAPVANYGTWPRRYFERIGVVTEPTTLTSELQPGVQFTSRATLDGEPLPGLRSFSISWPDYRNQTTSTLTTDANGEVAETVGNGTVNGTRPYYLRPGRYFLNGSCEALGVVVDELWFFGAFEFPAERSGFSCDLRTSPAVEYSHDHTRLVVTPGPGELGLVSGDGETSLGSGWGVQFPVEAPARPQHVPFNASHIFRGGLMIGVEPGVVLTGVDVNTYVECGGSCRDLGDDARVSKTAGNGDGRKITWTYSDAGSPDAVGLEIRQTSFDGQLPNDYVLFNYQFHNKSDRTLTFYAGGFYDWDVDEVGVTPAESGGSEFGGRLMFNVGRAGTHVGTYMIGDYPTVGAYHFVNFINGVRVTPSIADQMNVMRGTLRALTTPSADARYLQSIGPITLKKGHKAQVWIAVVAGESRAELVANALAAEADSKSRRNVVASDGDAGGASLHVKRANKSREKNAGNEQ